MNKLLNLYKRNRVTDIKITLDKKMVLVFLNLCVFIYIVSSLLSWPCFLSGPFLCLMIFIVPGMAAEFFCLKNKRAPIEKVFYWVVISTIFLILGIALAVKLNIKITGVNYSIYVLLLVNTSFLIGRLLSDDKKHRQLSVSVPLIVLIFCAGILLCYLAVDVIPPLQDNTLTVQSTAYGISRHFLPKTFTDRFLCYEFAHPLLMHFYTAASISLSGELEVLKYYYDYANASKALLEQKPRIGEAASLSIHNFGDIETKIIGIDGASVVLNKKIPPVEPNQRRGPIGSSNFIIENTIAEDYTLIPNAPLTDKINYEILRQGEYWKMARKVYNNFYDNPHLFSSRLPNVFFTLTGCLALYALLSFITGSYRLSLIGTLSFITIPEILIRSIGGSYTSITLFCAIILIYFYLNNQRKMLFLAAFFSALANHKLLIVVVAIALAEIIRGKFLKKDSNAWIIILGFLGGEALFSAYGLSIHAQSFVQDHFYYHFINRIFHISDLGYGGYPDTSQLWISFFTKLNPFLTLCFLVSLFLSVMLFLKDAAVVLPLYFIIGGVIFSVVDWRSTKHLMLVVPALVSMFFAVSSRIVRFKKIFVPILLCGIIFNVVFIIYFVHTKEMLIISKHW